jgi:phospholipid/cholesterol/gamma-HCH transport system permease protein
MTPTTSPPPGSSSRIAAPLGRAALVLLSEVRALFAVFRSTVRYAFSGSQSRHVVFRQMYEIGNRSTVFLCVAMGFIGMIFVYQAGLQMLRVIPDLTLLGATFLELLVRDLAASICALLLATRVGAGIAAEIGSMVVTEQVDALRMCATDPVEYLVAPRFVASIVMTTALVVIAGGVAFSTGMWTAYTFFGVTTQTFADTSLLDTGDVVVGLAKCVVYGAAIPVVSGHSGLSTTGGSEGVGWATTRAVVNSSLAVIALNFVVSSLGYFIFG